MNSKFLIKRKKENNRCDRFNEVYGAMKCHASGSTRKYTLLNGNLYLHVIISKSYRYYTLSISGIK